MSLTYSLISARGRPHELGRQHGEQARSHVVGFVDFLQSLLKLSDEQLRSRALQFLPLFEKHCPELLEEIKGLAEGANVTLADALAVQLRGELGHVGDGACTTFVLGRSATSNGQVLIGQNSDVEPEYEQFAYVLHLRPTGKPAILMWTFGGQLGYHGVNSAGVAHFANALGGGPSWRFALSHYPVKRMMLEQERLEGVFSLLDRVPVCSNGNYVVCDGAGAIADIELTSEGLHIIHGGERGYLAHANHFLCGAHACAANHEASLPDSFARQDRVQKLLTEKMGSITLADLQRILADHDGFPVSICRHSHDGPDHPSVSARGRTTASLIAEPAAGKLHVCRGNPCVGAFREYRLNE